MGFATPRPPGFDLAEWAGRPYRDRLQMMCVTWASQGFGAPAAAYLFYVVKLVAYVGGFVAVTGATTAVGDGLAAWATPEVFTKALVWTLLWESVGLGCGSGPLTGRYLPPVTAIGYWLRPGTTRLAPWPWVPFTRGDRRSVVDVAVYAAVVGLAIRVLVAGQPGAAELAPLVATFIVAGLRDKAVFLAGRPEHYLVAITIVALAGNTGGMWAGQKVLMVLLWLGAATSKLNHHFPGVIAVMLSNNPMLASPRIRHRLYRHYPDDLRPSRIAAGIAHGATVVEYTFPLVLLLSSGGWPTTVALVVMVAFHLAILTSFPLGVPLEWNVFFIYAGLVVFGVHADVPVTDIGSAAVVALLAAVAATVVVGNLRPDKVSFLPSMRYYAGNWATSLWLLRPGVLERIDDTLTTTARSPRRQVERLYGPGVFDGVLGRTQAFRSMHLHGRALNRVLPTAVADLDADLDDFEVVDGELVAGLALGWNFGDGHLHNGQLLGAIGRQCGFAPGEVRCVMLESQPMGSPALAWRVVDGATGEVARGSVTATSLLDVQPWQVGPAGGSDDHPTSPTGHTGNP